MRKVTMTNPEHQTMPTIDDLIDRLLDGAVQPGEMRKAVKLLDATPDGWRRCAVAFLEAQSWGDAMRCEEESAPTNRLELRGFMPQVLSGHSGIDPVRPCPDTQPLRGGRLLAASVVLVAFTLGWAGHGWRTQIAREKPENPNVVDTGSSPRVRSGSLDEAAPPSSGPLPEAEPQSLAVRGPIIQEVARLRIGTGKSTTAEVPILAGTGIDERFLLEQPPAVSEHQRAVWERLGYQLEQRRRLVSIPLSDGRRAAVPIDQVKVRYVGREPL
jgi:hypothetical protein